MNKIVAHDEVTDPADQPHSLFIKPAWTVTSKTAVAIQNPQTKPIAPIVVLEPSRPRDLRESIY